MKRFFQITFILLLMLPVSMGRGGFEKHLELAVVETAGDWDTTTPMFLNATDTVDEVYCEINATNINADNELIGMQYLYYIFDYVDYDEPTVGNPLIGYIHEVEINFTSISTIFKLRYNWQLTYDLGVTTYTGTLQAWLNSTMILTDIQYSYEKTHQLEMRFWRSKSSQFILYYKLGEESTVEDFITSDVLLDWNIGNFTYYFETSNEGAFVVVYEDFGYQCGSNEGISDPIEDESWGFFEPIRQIGLFIINLFLDLVKIVLPDDLEDVFDHYIDKLGSYIDPVLEIMFWMGDNWLEMLILINMFLLLKGVDAASEGDLANVIMPFWNFYSSLIGFVVSILGFIVNVIKTLIEAIPFI